MHDIFNNPRLKSLMVLYLMMMGFDLLGRYVAPQPAASEAAKVQNNGAVAGAAGQTADSTATIEENGDAIPVDRTHLDQGGYTRGTSGRRR